MVRPRSLAAHAFERAMLMNIANIERLLERNGARKLLDVGCDDGERTLAFGRSAGAEELYGFEAIASRAEEARQRGVVVEIGDVTQGLPYGDASFDAVVSNQVIEHLADTDLFVAECRRVVQPGGLVVVSTENLASWHNVFAAAMGWQPFSLTNVSSTTGGLGNPLAVFRGQPHTQPSSWQHLRVFAYRGLVELFSEQGFAVEKVEGAGYYPFPAQLGRRDPRHAAFLTVAARRPL